MRKLRMTVGTALLSTGLIFAQKTTIDFNARGLLTLSDGDMAASALIDGKLLKEAGVKDALSVYPLPLALGKEIGSSPVPNSSIGWMRTVTLMSDGRYAFVIETRGQTLDNVTEVKNVATDLPEGGNLYIVDISNMAKPTARKAPIGKNPSAIDMLGNNVVITSEEPGKELRLFEIGSGGLPTRNVPMPLNLTNARATNVAWHPGGEFIAITVEETKEIWLYKAIMTAQGKIGNFEPFGAPVKVEGKPGPGTFTPDGNIFIVSDLKDGAAGELAVIQFNTTATDAKTAEHKLIGQTPVAGGAESFAISPDGTMLVTANKKQSAQPWSGNVGRASVTLMTISKEGTLGKVADYDIDGIAPEGIIFDKTGDNVAVTAYEYFDYGNRNGGVEFFKVNKGATPSLTKQLAKISAPKGCHTVKLIP